MEHETKDILSDVAPTRDRPDGSLPAARPALERRRAFAWVPHRWALALILLLTAFGDFYQLQREGFANLYYAAAIRSMLESWHNFFFVSFDPGGFVSVDKPPVGFWIQTASAKLLGYSGFSILLPEALAGIASVGVLYLLVRRLFGIAPALLSALFLAITPVSVVTNRYNTIDSLLVLAVLLAAYAVSRAGETGGLRWLLLCAVLVGLGFNIKMLEAYLVVPAFALMYLLAAPVGWWKRLWHLAVAAAAMAALSLCWVLAVDLTPASARPYVGSSGSNSELALALGYNGVERLVGNIFHISARVASGPASVATRAEMEYGFGGNGAAGVLRLLNAQLGGQASWLLALGIVGTLASGWGFRPGGWLPALPLRTREWRASAEARVAAHLTPRQAALVLWGMWTLTMVVFFSIAGFFHSYYLSMLAPGIAALAGIGVVLLWRDYRNAATCNWHGWLLPAALVMTAVTQAVILTDYSGWNSWMTPLIVGGSLVVAGVLVALRLANAYGISPSLLPASVARRTYTPVVAATLGIALLLLGPATWVGISLASTSRGESFPSAGPSASLGGSGSYPRSASGGSMPAGYGGFAGLFSGSLRVNSALLRYLEGHQGSAKYLFATQSSMPAAPYIIESGRPVMALGGFDGSDQILTVSQLKMLVREGQVHYFLLSGGGFFAALGGLGNAPLVRWVKEHGTAITVRGTMLYYVSSAAAS